MRARHVGERPHYTRKHTKALYVLKYQHGLAAQGRDRAWCYAKLAELEYRWDGADGVWVKLTGM